jgi:AcrR family transcriptional regulator
MPAPEIRDKIIEKAASLFAYQGYDAVSMRRIATSVGMTQGNLYYHFKDKEDLILSCLAAVFKGKTQAMEAVLQQESDPQRCLERSLAWFATMLFEDPIFAKLLFRELLEGDATRLKFLTENVFQGSFDTLVVRITNALDTADPMLAAIFLTSTVIGYRLFAGIIPHLRGANPEYIDPKKIIQLLLGEIRKNAKLPGGEAVAS